MADSKAVVDKVVDMVACTALDMELEEASCMEFGSTIHKD